MAKKKKNPKRENGQVPRPGCVRGVVPQVYKDSVPRHISLLTFSFPMQVSCVCFLLIHTLTVPYCFTTQQVKLGHFTFKMSIIQDLDLWSLRFSLYFSSIKVKHYRKIFLTFNECYTMVAPTYNLQQKQQCIRVSG